MMPAVWRERRIRNRLLKRELLLRAEAERVGAPGMSGPPTEYFREQKRRPLLRNPRFAIEYRRARKQGGTIVPPGILRGVRPPTLDLLEFGAENRRHMD